ncbi:MAG: hypothetical protein LDL33_11775 [Desulfomonile sp.]|nr:hypothetical protein [Desulfomonile sp.]
MDKAYRLILILFAAVVMCSVLATLAFGVWICFSDIVDCWGLEHNVVYGVIKLLSGKSLYGDPLSPPFDVVQYAPLFYLLSAGAAGAFGIEAQSVYQVSVVARGVSTVCAALLCLAIYFFATRVKHTARLIAALCSATVLILEFQCLFVGLPNTLQSLCMFLTVALAATSLVRSDSENQSRWLVLTALSGLFGAAALLSKQSGIQGIFIVAAFLALKRLWGHLICFIGVSFLVAVLFFVVAEPLLGDSWRENIIEGIRNPIALKAVFVTTYHPFFSQLSILVAYAVVVTLDWLERSPADEQMLLLWAMWAMWAFALATSLKIGSAAHYFNDFIVMLAPCAAMHLTQMTSEPSEAPQGGRRLVVILAVTFLFLFPMRTIYTIGRTTTSLKIVNNTYSSRTEIVDYLRGKFANRPVSWFFAEDQVLPLFLPEVGLFPHPDVMAYYPRKEIALENYLNLVRHGHVAYLVLSDPHKFTPWFIPKPGGFVLEKVIGPYRVYHKERDHMQ